MMFDNVAVHLLYLDLCMQIAFLAVSEYVEALIFQPRNMGQENQTKLKQKYPAFWNGIVMRDALPDI